MKNVTGIDKPRCSRCGEFKAQSELNGYDPLAKGAAKYAKAYCRNVFECDSPEARKSTESITNKFEQMQAEGRAKIKRSCSLDELKALPPEELTGSERALLEALKKDQ